MVSGSLSPASVRWSAAGKELRLSSDTSLDLRSCVATANKTPASPTQRTVRASLLWSDVPGCSHMAASAAKPAIAANIPKTTAAEKRPCSKVRNAWVKERRDIQPKMPDWPASAKSNAHEPIVKPSVTMAAVAELSEIAAAKSAI